MLTKTSFSRFWAHLAGIVVALGLLTGCGQPAPTASPTVTSVPPSVQPSDTPSATPDPANVTVPGDLSAPYPTINNISIEWLIEGDANLNGVTAVHFRQAGDTDWREGMPLHRVPAGENERTGFSWPNKHSGSIFDLEPATTYEIALTLTDPDGGSATQTLTATTRAVPAPMADAPVKRVRPETFAAAAAAAQPGDILELEAGVYEGFTFEQDGEPGRPIVIRSADGEAVIEGAINLDSRKHIILDGLIVNGSIHFYAGDSIAVTHSRVTTENHGIIFQGRSQNVYIADNVVVGSTAWQEAALGTSGDNTGEGIEFSGPGHVIQNNTVIGFRDNISFMEEDEAVDQFSIDVLNNDIYNAADDGVEADYCFHNCRIMNNRLTNVFMGLSSQPSLGGPTYYIRNVMYNVIYAPFKLHNYSVGDVILQNTIAKSGDAFGIYTGDYFQNAYVRNNIFLGGPGGLYNGYNSGKGLIASLGSAGENNSFDYDAFGTKADRFLGQIGSVLFRSLEELRAKTTEQHAIQVDWDIFVAPVVYPEEPCSALPVADLRVKAGSPVQDAAQIIPNVNDSFTGAGPDIGAYEIGQTLPVYGPRIEPRRHRGLCHRSEPLVIPSLPPASGHPLPVRIRR